MIIISKPPADQNHIQLVDLLLNINFLVEKRDKISLPRRVVASFFRVVDWPRP